MNQTGNNQKNIRTQNMLQALKIIIFEGPISRKELAQQMGLSKMSISNIVNTFLAKGMVKEVASDSDMPANSGPKPLLLQIASGVMVAIGLHITEYAIYGQLFDVVAGVQIEKKILMEDIHSKANFINNIKLIVDQLMEYGKTRNLHIIGIGITENHFVNRKEGLVVFKGNRFGIDSEFITKNLEQDYKVPIYLEQEHMGTLLTEMAYGVCDINKKLYYLQISDEIRGAFTCGYYIQKGCVGLSGMTGHISIKYDGPKCSCGNRGCYERYGSIPALLKNSNCSSISELNSHLQNREPTALRAIETFIQVTSTAITNLVNLYDPEAFVITGKMLQLDHSVFKKIEYLVNNNMFFRNQRSISIIPTKLTEDDYKKGSAVLVFYRIVSDKDYISSICDVD